MYTPYTTTITRRTIKRVETRIKGLSGLGSLRGMTVSLPTPPPSNTPPISGTSTNQSITFQQFWDFLTGRQGELKIEATQFVEGMVRTMYGLEPDMRMPTPGIPVIPNNSSPSFASATVAGMIERCRLIEAQTALQSINSEFRSRMANASDPLAPFIKRWWDEYGRNDISNLTTKIQSAWGTCGITGGIPKLCTAPLVWSATQLKCVYPSETTPGGGISTIAIIGMLAFAVLMMRR